MTHSDTRIGDFEAYSTNDGRLVGHFPPGASTASPLNLSYRLGKLKSRGIVEGHWLDYGCADGNYAAGLLERGATCATGVDVIEERVAEATRKHEGAKNLRFLHVPSNELPFDDDTFDGTLLNEVLEHVLDEKKTLSEIYRVLRHGGHLAIMSPNRYFPFEGHGAHFGKLTFGFPVPLLPWIPSRLSQQFMLARNYWPYELKHLVRSAGFTITYVNFILPVFEHYEWLPLWAIEHYRKIMPILDKTPFVRRFGVSVLIAAQKPLMSR